MIKRFFAFLLALIWAFALSACDGSPASSQLPALTSDPVVPVSEKPSAPLKTDPAEAEEPSHALEFPDEEPSSSTPAVTEDGWYSSKEDVALYIHLYGHLPDNYVTKKEAQELGWTGGSVERYVGEGTAIGGSRFGNYEGLLPEAEGRTYTECDIDTVGSSSRGAKRVVFSNDGLIYYTGDHYESFELLYGEP